jgi:hypothetical protein
MVKSMSMTDWLNMEHEQYGVWVLFVQGDVYGRAMPGSMYM